LRKSGGSVRFSLRATFSERQIVLSAEDELVFLVEARNTKARLLGEPEALSAPAPPSAEYPSAISSDFAQV
jgi:hypothetical protein